MMQHALCSYAGSERRLGSHLQPLDRFGLMTAWEHECMRRTRQVPAASFVLSVAEGKHSVGDRRADSHVPWTIRSVLGHGRYPAHSKCHTRFLTLFGLGVTTPVMVLYLDSNLLIQCPALA